MNINKFNNKIDLTRPYIMIIQAPRNSGKSYFFKQLYKINKMENYYDIIILFSNTLLNDGYDYIDSDLKFTEYEETVINNILELQNKRKEENKPLYKVLVVFDDIINNNLKFNKTIRKIYLTGRHFNISLVQIIQDLNILSPELKNNSTMVITFNLKGRNKIKFIENYLMDYIEGDNIKQIITKSNKLLDSVFNEKYKALIIDLEKSLIYEGKV